MLSMGPQPRRDPKLNVQFPTSDFQLYSYLFIALTCTIVQRPVAGHHKLRITTVQIMNE